MTKLEYTGPDFSLEMDYSNGVLTLAKPVMSDLIGSLIAVHAARPLATFEVLPISAGLWRYYYLAADSTTFEQFLKPALHIISPVTITGEWTDTQINAHIQLRSAVESLLRNHGMQSLEVAFVGA